MANAIGEATVKANGGLNVRKGAGTSYGTLGALSNGAKVDYYGEQNGWLQIKYSGSTGWISKQYTSVTKTSSGTGSTGSSSGSAGSSTSSGKVKITASSLNVRKGAGTNYGTLGGLSNGEVVDYFGEKSGWLQINYKGQTGWISKQYTTSVSSGGSKPSTPAPKPEAPASSAKGKVEITASTLNVRSGAGTSNSKIGELDNGAVVEYYGEKNGWLQIKYSGKTGWISKDYTMPYDGSSSGHKSGGGEERSASQSGGLNAHTKNYKQYASPWGPKMYSIINDKSQTYGTSACGPTACASVIAKWVDSSVTPYTLGTWAIKHGHRTRNNGTTHAFVPAIMKEYGLPCQKTSVSDGVKALQKGKYAVAAMGSGYWTKSGHFITPYASDGSTIYVDDPGHSSRPNGFKQSKSQFAKECSAFWVIG